MKEECWKTFKNRGECCCVCEHHYPYFSHPWVDNKPCTNQLGYVCVCPHFMNRNEDSKSAGPTISNEHGLCELFKRR